MKISKIFAAGIAATMAVSSLAAVSSAATEKTFNMAMSKGSISATHSEAKELAYLYDAAADKAAKECAAYTTPGVLTYDFTNATGGYVDWGKGTGKQVHSIADETLKVENVVLKITGIKGTKNSTSQVYEYKFYNPDGNTKIWKLDLGQGTGFIPDQFVEITRYDFEIKTSFNGIAEESDYNQISDYKEGVYIAGVTVTNTATAAAGIGTDIANLAFRPGWEDLDYVWGSAAIKNEYAWIGQTDFDGGYIRRNDCAELSTTVARGTQQNVDQHAAKGFEGLASQVASFFNKQNNGKIVFKFTPATTATSGWTNGGVYNTEMGLKNALGSTGFALFVNYNATTGDLQTVGQVDSAAATVTFDISEILDALGGQTIGTIQDIWYGMNNGLEYEAGKDKGYWVETVTLSYDEDAAADADVDDEDDAPVADDEDDAQIDDADDADDYDDADDDEDDAVVDDTADDGEVAADIVVVTPADDDANPGTGVALAIVPAILAGAAVVISRKRK